MNAAIVGAGLVGPVLALALARDGHAVQIHERNGDPRLKDSVPGKSMNLTLCARGLAALDAVGAGDAARRIAVPVYGRVIHARPGQVDFQPYGGPGDALWSISRHRLSQLLVDRAAAAGIPIRFGQKCVDIDAPAGVAVFESGDRVEADLVVAADGARSAVRGHLIRRGRVDYSQHYSDHANKELSMPAESARAAGLEPGALHIWPRGQFMLIAFPNPDGSFTCTLHLPLSGDPSFDAIHTEADLERLFAVHMPDVRPFLPTLAGDFFSHPAIPMVTVRMNPWTFGRVALIGDAAHAVWPSYGQGANAGFEDTTVLSRWLRSAPVPQALRGYEDEQRPNAAAIAELSEHHFDEIRDRIADPAFLARKRVERWLHEQYPDRYASLYARIAFTLVPYAECVRLEGLQRELVDRLVEAGPDADQLIHTLMRTAS